MVLNFIMKNATISLIHACMHSHMSLSSCSGKAGWFLHLVKTLEIPHILAWEIKKIKKK